MNRKGIVANTTKKIHLNNETWTRLEGHHISPGSTRNFRNSPAQPNPSTWIWITKHNLW